MTFVWIALLGVLTVAFFVLLFVAEAKDAAVALGGVIGGIIGAAGAAGAVYINLQAQQDDESRRVRDALRREVIEFVRFVLGHLETCENIHTHTINMPTMALPNALRLPKPVVYPASATLIARLPAPQRYAAFYTRQFEIGVMAEGIAGRPTVPLGPNVTAAEIATIGAALINILGFGRAIIENTDTPTGLDDATGAEMVHQIDRLIGRTSSIFPDQP